MNSWLSLQSPFPVLLLFIMFLVLVEVPVSFCSYDWYSTCNNQFSCGEITNVGYPFWGDGRPDGCGNPDLKLNCDRNITTIGIKDVLYRVLAVNTVNKILKIARQDYLNGICLPDLVNTTLDPQLFDYGLGYGNITLFYGCPVEAQFSCSINGFTSKGGLIQLGAQGPGFCSASVVLPFPSANYKDIANWLLVEGVIKSGFDVQWKEDTAACNACIASKGVCGYDLSTNQTTCFCPNQPDGSETCPSSPAAEASPSTPGTRATLSLGVGIVFIAAFSAGVVGTIVFIYYRKRGVRWNRDAMTDDFRAEEIIKKYGSTAPKRYSYSDLKKLTNSFKHKIGKGGFGVVYKGKLHDGRIVAVKVLISSKGDGEEFVNEVASISGTSHVNVVTLLGFCYERTKRALIYEFMSNGSLDKFIYGGNSSMASLRLDDKMMLQIAVGIARGLEYLHRGCRTRILHFDIKPHNILLDEDLCPKISDFGLSKLCKTEQSIVSMMSMRGTPGYIAPEVFSRCFGGVSHKSDVYSYGMLVLEMVGRKKEFTEGTSNSSEVHFPDTVYSKLEQGENVGTFGESRGEEEEIIKKMAIVGLWCIQTHPSDRPSMSKVIEMLEGTSHSLHIPPRPCLDSPKRSPQDSSTSSLWERVDPSEGE